MTVYSVVLLAFCLWACAALLTMFPRARSGVVVLLAVTLVLLLWAFVRSVG